MIYVLFICIVTPMTLMLFLLDKKSRLTVGFMLIGIYLHIAYMPPAIFILTFFPSACI